MIIGAFLAFTVVGQIINVLLCLAFDRIFSPTIGALAFVALYILVFVAAYQITLFLFDRGKTPDSALSPQGR